MGELRFTQLDFVWSPFRARRRHMVFASIAGCGKGRAATFEIRSRRMSVSRDEQGHLRQLTCATEPYFGPAEAGAIAARAAPMSPRELADTYVREMLPNLGLDNDFARNLETAAAATGAVADERPHSCASPKNS